MNASAGVILSLMVLAGCGRLVSIDYEATNVLKGAPCGMLLGAEV